MQTIIITGLLLVAAVAVIALVSSTVLSRSADVHVWIVSDEWLRASTPAGRADIRRVLHDERGIVYEITTRFRGAPRSIHHCAPARPVLRSTLERLSTEHLQATRRTATLRAR